MSKRIEIRASELIEYGALMQRMALDPEMKTVSSMGDMFYEIRDSTDGCMSALLKNDVAYFSGSLHIHQLVFEYGTFLGVDAVEVFLTTLKDVTQEELLDHYVYGLLGIHLDGGLEAIRQRVKEDESLKTCRFDGDNLVEFIEQFDDLRGRLLLYFENFYQKVFLPNKSTIMKVAKNNCLSVRRWYTRDPEGFIHLMVRANREGFVEPNSDYMAVFYMNVTYPNNVGFMMSNNHPEALHVIFGSYVVKMFKASASEELIKYLGDSTKMSIIKMLAKKPMYASEVASNLNLNRATISHHIHQLAKVSAVRIAYTKGNKAYYETNPKQIAEGFSRFVDQLVELGGVEG